MFLKDIVFITFMPQSNKIAVFYKNALEQKIEKTSVYQPYRTELMVIRSEFGGG